MRSVIIGLSLLLSNVSFAQDTIDSHNFHLAPNDGDPLGGLATWNARPHYAGSYSGGAIFEYGREPLVLYQRSSSGQLSTMMIDSYSALNLSAFYAPHERVALAVSTPLYLSSTGMATDGGLGLGDVRAAASVSVLRPSDGSRYGWFLSVIPFMDVPGFYRDNQMGLSGVSGGGMVAVTGRTSVLVGSVNAGVQFSPDVDFYNLEGGERLVSSLMGGVMLSDELALRGEVLYTPGLYKNDVPRTDTPLETVVSLRGETGDHLTWTLGGSTALTRSVGAPMWRAFAGVQMSFGVPREADCDSCRGVRVMGAGVYQGEDYEPVEDGRVYAQDSEMQLTEISDFSSTVVDDFTTVTVYCTVPEPEQELVVVTETEILLMEPIYFDFDKASIRFPESSEVLDALVETLQSHTDIELVEVAGHTDSRGSFEYNDQLSQARVDSVVSYLAENGVDQSRLHPVGYGERTHLLECDESDEDCHQTNRRVQFTILRRE